MIGGIGLLFRILGCLLRGLWLLAARLALCRCLRRLSILRVLEASNEFHGRPPSCFILGSRQVQAQILYIRLRGSRLHLGMLGIQMVLILAMVRAHHVRSSKALYLGCADLVRR